MGYPVPEIVLAENPNKKRSFIVIDGKQRLLTLAGFIDNEKYKYSNVHLVKAVSSLIPYNSLKCCHTLLIYSCFTFVSSL